MTSYTYVDDGPPSFDTPTLVVMLSGWIDASGAAGAAMAALELECVAQTIATFDGDTYVDYRARRPTMALRKGVNTGLEWPDIEVKAGRDTKGRDVLLLTGPEPDMAWRRFSADLTSMAVELGVARMVVLGAYPYATPHTRPVRLSMTTPSAEIAVATPLLKNSADVPAGVAAELELAFHRIDIPALGLWVQVPHYIASMAYPAATVALLDALDEIGGVRIPGADARRETIIQRARLDELVAANSEHMAMVNQLEAIYDGGELVDEESEFGAGIADSPALSADEIPTADELGAELEQFLRDQNGG